MDLLQRALTRYEDRVGLLAKAKGKPALPADDAWVWGGLGDDLRRGGGAGLTVDRLARVMAWKLARGKFRPRLTQLVRENSEEAAADAGAEAMAAADAGDVRAAVKALCVLRGVGPATASAVLAAYRPGVFAFMADEALAAVCSRPFKYSLPEYLQFSAEVAKLAKRLGSGWTPHDVSQALWSQAVGRTLGDDDSEDESGGEGEAEKAKAAAHPKRKPPRTTPGRPAKRQRRKSAAAAAAVISAIAELDAEKDE